MSKKSEIRNSKDRVIDALLQGYATHGGDADEAFLAKVEEAIDQDPLLKVVEISDQDLRAPKRSSVFAWSLGIAAGLVAIFLGVLSHMVATVNQTSPPQVVAHVLESQGTLELQRSKIQKPAENSAVYSYSESDGPTYSGQIIPRSSERFAMTGHGGATSIHPEKKELLGSQSIPTGSTREDARGAEVERPESHARSEAYNPLVDNEFQSPQDHPLSTFSVDVDTASYTNIRRMIRDGVGTIPKDAVRIEEMINYFSYEYPLPKDEHPFAFALEAANCPWAEDHQLLRVGIQGQRMEREQRPAANLVFLLDVSGSMKSANKLPLVKQAMSILVEELDQSDKVSIVVYAGAEGLCLPATSGDQQATILASLENLKSGGSTNGRAGIELAYKVAAENFIEDGINRVLLCTDGDFNVGTTNQGGLVELVSERAKTGTFLSVLGFGSGNINDAMLEAITNKGNGTYYYVDTIQEARKVFLQDIMATLVTIAKDVKIQIEFNPAQVQSYRLIGYANRMLKAEDFEDDRVDAGEIGAGHQVTALYEIVPVGVDAEGLNRTKPGLKYQRKPQMEIVDSPELANLKLRYKLPDSDVSIPVEQPIVLNRSDWSEASADFKFATSLGLFGMHLRDSDFKGSGSIADVLELATEGKGNDPHRRRSEFIDLVRKYEERQ